MQYEKKTYRVDNPAVIKSVVLMDVDVAVEALSSGDGSMYATYYISDKEKYDIEVDDGTLYIRKKLRPLFAFLTFRRAPDEIKLTIYLPAGYDGELSITTVDGGIGVDGIAAASMAVKTTDGYIAVARSHFTGGITCKTLDGNISASSVTATEAMLKTADGDILLNRPIISDRLSCRTTDGNITGTLAGRASDYTLMVRTGDGHSNVFPGGTGKTLCEVKTADGDIELSFADEG